MGAAAAASARKRAIEASWCPKAMLAVWICEQQIGSCPTLRNLSVAVFGSKSSILLHLAAGNLTAFGRTWTFWKHLFIVRALEMSLKIAGVERAVQAV